MRKKALQADNQRAPHIDQDKEFMRIAIELASTSAEQGGGLFAQSLSRTARSWQKLPTV